MTTAAVSPWVARFHYALLALMLLGVAVAIVTAVIR